VSRQREHRSRRYASINQRTQKWRKTLK